MLSDSSKSNKSQAVKLPANSSQPRFYSVMKAFGVVLISVIITQALAAALISFYPFIAGLGQAEATEWLETPAANFAVILLFEVLSVSVIALYARRKKVSFWHLAGLQKPTWWHPLLSFVGMGAYMIAFVLIFMVVDNFSPIDTTGEQALAFERGAGGTALLMAFVGLVILPPIAEEVVFRGYFYGSLRSTKLSVIWATLITSIVFGSLHLFGGTEGLLWIAFVDTFVLSVVLCALREYTGNIWACIGVHALKNGFVFLNLFIINA